MPEALRGDWCLDLKLDAYRRPVGHSASADPCSDDPISITATGFDTYHEYGCTLISRRSGGIGGEYLFKCESWEGSNGEGPPTSVWYERYRMRFNAHGFLVWEDLDRAAKDTVPSAN